MNRKPHAGDLANYQQRGAAEPTRCEVLGYTAKRVRIWVRTAAGATSVRYVKAESLTRIAGWASPRRFV